MEILHKKSFFLANDPTNLPDNTSESESHLFACFFPVA